MPVYPSMPTAFRLATESAPERERSQKENTDTTQEQGTENAFGVESLNDSMSCTPLAGVSKRLNDDPKEAASDAGPTEPLQPALETSAEEILKTSSMLAKEPSLNATSQRHSRQHSFSHSIASVSLDSQAPLSSLPSSPKSISNRSLRVSDEESVDDGGSQAIASSSEDESRTALHDSSPQLIMPSIKMPSRRPFTEKGRGLGRLKILFAGDSGAFKTQTWICGSDLLLQVWERPLSSSPSSKHARILSTLTRFQQLPHDRSQQRNQSLGRKLLQLVQRIESRRSMPVQGHIQVGGQRLMKRSFCTDGKVWVTWSWRETSALWIHRDTATEWQRYKVLKQWCII